MLPKGFSCAGEDDNGDFQPDFDGGNSDHEAVAESEPDADVWERVDDKVIRHHNVPRQQLFSPMAADGIPCGFNEILPFRFPKTAELKLKMSGQAHNLRHVRSLSGRGGQKLPASFQSKRPVMWTWTLIIRPIKMGKMDFAPQLVMDLLHQRLQVDFELPELMTKL
jgi:hypothetical protein